MTYMLAASGNRLTLVWNSMQIGVRDICINSHQEVFPRACRSGSITIFTDDPEGKARHRTARNGGNETPGQS